MTRTKAKATKPHAVTLQEMAGGAISIADLRPDELVDIDSVIEHPENARRGDLASIVESIQQHGIYRRLIVQRQTPTGEARMRVIAGNHTRRAAKQLGYTKLPMEFIDCTDAKARKILLVDNRTNDKAGYDHDALAALLADLQKADADGLTGTGFTDNDLDDLRAMLAPPTFDAVEAKHGIHNAEDLWPIIKLMVPPAVKERFDAIFASLPGETDCDRLTALLDRVDETER